MRSLLFPRSLVLCSTSAKWRKFSNLPTSFIANASYWKRQKDKECFLKTIRHKKPKQDPRWPTRQTTLIIQIARDIIIQLIAEIYWSYWWFCSNTTAAKRLRDDTFGAARRDRRKAVSAFWKSAFSIRKWDQSARWFWSFLLAFLPKNERCILPVQSTWLQDYPDVDCKIIQGSTTKISRYWLHNLPENNRWQSAQPSSSFFIFWRDDKLPGHCHLVSNFSTSLALYQGDKRPGSFVI